MSLPAPKVILVGNYENDQQQSMLRFAELLRSELQKLGIAVELIRPRPFFGLLKRGATGLGKWLGYLDKFLLFPIELKRAIRNSGTHAVVHICDHSNAFYTHSLQNIPHLVTCNDLLAIRSALGEFPQNPTGWTGRRLQRWILQGLRTAQRITCISSATRSDLLRLLPEKETVCDVTFMGLNHPYLPMAREEALEKARGILGASSPFILHVGGNQWYKNRLGVLKIFVALDITEPAQKLVMVGPDFDSEMREFLRTHPQVAARVISVSDVDGETLRALYSAAELLLFPSIKEGFGWPIVEAQACGCRVVTTNTPPMTETGGDAAFYTSGASTAAAAVVERVLAQNETERAAAISRGLENAARFSAEKMALRYVEIYRELAYKLQPMSYSILHIIRSVDPAGGGPVEVLKQIAKAHIAMGHKTEVVSLDSPEAAWTKDFPLTLHTLGETAGSHGSYGFSAKLVPWLAANRKKYDAVISHGLWQYNNAGTWHALRGTDTPYFVFPHGMLDPWFRRAYPAKHFKKLAYWMLRERRVLRDAAAVLFTCQEECALARGTFPFFRCNERVVLLGIAAPPLQEARRQRELFLEKFPLLRGKKTFLFLGRLHNKKGCGPLIEAFAKTAAKSNDGWHLAMAGPCADETYLQELQQLAKSLCPPGSVSFPGMLTGDLKWGAFHAADVFVLPSHQENFGIAVAEALACGLPVLISNKVNIWCEIQEDSAGMVEADNLAGTTALIERWMHLDNDARTEMRTDASNCFANRFEIQKTAYGLLDLIAPFCSIRKPPHASSTTD
jgi:glycosyltransferase involved in cell wall biosynthesis